MDFQTLCRAPVRFGPIYNKESEQIKGELVSFIRRGKKDILLADVTKTTVVRKAVTADKHYSDFYADYASVFER